MQPGRAVALQAKPALEHPLIEASGMRRRVASDVLLTALAQMTTMAIGGILAILVAAKFGSDAHTDGFFAAYGVYAVLILLPQSSRVTMVARLVASAHPLRLVLRVIRCDAADVPPVRSRPSSCWATRSRRF